MPELYFIASAEETAAAARWGHPLAHMAYGMGKDTLELTVRMLPLTTRGGWMVLTDQIFPQHGEIRQFAVQVRQELRSRRYEAVLFDFERPANDRAYEIIKTITAGGVPCLVPTTYADVFPTAKILVESGISGGDLKEYLAEQLDKWPDRICLVLRPLRMRFPMPSATSEGLVISEADLNKALQERPSFFSRELGCRYVTQQIDGQYYFTLYDDTASLRYKLELADQLGISTAAALYQEIKSLLPL